MKSEFKNDLAKEILLGKHLDRIYREKLSGFEIERVTDLDLQNQGVDLKINTETTCFYIDEKAQLDYMDNDLPTFAFEVSYLKNAKEHLGWLFDSHKKTHKYFLITAIYLNHPGYLESGIKSCKVTSVDRSKLIVKLEKRGLDYDRIISINQDLREQNHDGPFCVDELNCKSEGRFHFSKLNKAEQPINIVLRLDYLINTGVAKVVYP